MNKNQYKKMYEFITEVMDYFSQKKKETILTKEEKHLLFSALSVRQILRNNELAKLEKQENIREKNAQKNKFRIFQDNEIVYEGIVADYYEPVYAVDYKILKQKMSKLANLTPQEKDIVKVKIYQFQQLIKEEIWIRNNVFDQEIWIFGKWEKMQEIDEN